MAFWRLPLGVRDRLVAAVRGNTGWHLAIAKPESLAIARLGCAGVPVTRLQDCATLSIIELTTLLAPTPTDEEAHLAMSGDSVLVAFVNAPFESRVVNPDGSVTALEPFGTVEIDLRAAEQRPHDVGWVAMPTLPAGSMFLQTLADLRSDARILALRDRRGRLLRSARLESPIAFVASSPKNRILYAIRSIVGSEIVVYRYCIPESAVC